MQCATTLYIFNKNRPPGGVVQPIHEFQPTMHRSNFLPPFGGVRRLREPHPTMVYLELGFPHGARRYRPGGSPFSSLVRYGFETFGRFCDPAMAPYTPRVKLASRTPANQQSTNGVPVVGVSTPYGAVSNRGIFVFVPGLLEL